MLLSLFSLDHFLVPLNKHEKYSQTFMRSHWVHTDNRIKWQGEKFLLKHTSHKAIYSKGILYSSLVPCETEEHKECSIILQTLKSQRITGGEKNAHLSVDTDRTVEGKNYRSFSNTCRRGVRMMILIQFHHHNTI